MKGRKETDEGKMKRAKEEAGGLGVGAADKKQDDGWAERETGLPKWRGR